MEVIRASEYRTTAWKNGGGSTTEIAVSPVAASLDDFDWRVSMARVTSDGLFSEFSGIDRTLAILRGNGLTLTISDAAPVVLDENSEPIHFPGDTPTSARLIAGEIIDLNIMTRRGRFEHRLRRIVEPTCCDFDNHESALAIAYGAKVELSLPGGKTVLADGDTAILTRADDASFTITPAGSAGCYLVLLRPWRYHAG
ncbi:MAG: HutD family protein [Bradyrhizobium sp.]|nr:HutD family protein [Bradyrhizobium sp.]